MIIDSVGHATIMRMAMTLAMDVVGGVSEMLCFHLFICLCQMFSSGGSCRDACRACLSRSSHRALIHERLIVVSLSPIEISTDKSGRRLQMITLKRPNAMFRRFQNCACGFKVGRDAQAKPSLTLSACNACRPSVAQSSSTTWPR